MRFTTLLSIAGLFASVHTAYAVPTTIGELVELSGVANGPSEYNEEGYRALAALREAANIPTQTAPEARSDEGVLERMSNAERLANGLPLKAPMRRSHLGLNRLDPRITPQALPSPGPLQTTTGVLALRDGNGQKVGYVRKILINNNAQMMSTTTQSEALKVSITFDSLQSAPSRTKVSLPNPPVSGFPLLSLIQGRDNPNQDLSEGSFKYVYLGGAAQPGSGPGSTGVSGQNTYTASTAISRITQTDVWTFDRASAKLSPSWVNTDQTVKTFAFYSE